MEPDTETCGGCEVIALPSQRIVLRAADDESGVPAAALPAHEPLAPRWHGRVGTVSLGHLGGIGRGLVATVPAPNNELQMRPRGASESCRLTDGKPRHSKSPASVEALAMLF